MDLNLDTLKREIIEYLENTDLVVFRSNPGGLEGLPMVVWDSENHPDYQMFIDVARQVGAKMVLFASREFEETELDEALDEIEDCELSRDERREFEGRLRDLRVFVGVTCSLELAFDYESRMYVYEVRPDWYEEFLNTCDEIAAHLPAEDGAGESDSDLGGYFSRN